MTLVASVAFLVYALSRGKKGIRDIPAAYESEAKHLTWLLIFFLATYLIRAVSDGWIVPKLAQNDLDFDCSIDGEKAFCLGFSFV